MPKDSAKTKSFTNLSSKLLKLGLKTNFDFALHLPIRYEDETQVNSIKDACEQHGIIQIIAQVISYSWTNNNRHLIIKVQDNTASLNLRFINTYPSQIKQFSIGSIWRIRGEIKRGMLGLEIIHPICKNISIPIPTELTAIYPCISGLPQSYLQSCIKYKVKNLCNELVETIPQELLNSTLKHLNLMSLNQALEIIHFPKPYENIQSILDKTHLAIKRIKFDELLAQHLSLKMINIEIKKHKAIAFAKNNVISNFIQCLPFKLTQGQQKAWQEISNDLNKKIPMQRLLQGDVGSGKTIVAAMAACQVAGSNGQTALMAPTEILAYQLYNKFITWLEPLGININIITSSTTAKQKKLIKQQIADGSINIIIGTHAIIQKDIQFNNLGLAIIDEQHRFGVIQRLSLRTNNSNKTYVHQLMMSATPIPRTLAMSYYTNLDISIIHDMPKGRFPITTKLIDNSKREDIINKLAGYAAQGKQVYWICPLIEENENLDLENAIQTYNTLCQSLPNHIKIGLIHGRLPNKEKQELMHNFKNHILDILVATTVIEVGVDVPNASLMIIEHAERFGLAQLHQLRGRVGRGSIKSVCILLYQQPLSYTGIERLKTMYETQNGFLIAQKDLELRGAGELLGAKQSGDILRFADVNKDINLVETSLAISNIIIKKYPQFAQKHIDLWINKKFQYIFA